MKKYILNFVVFLSALNVQAHHVDVSSTMLIEQEDNNWVLQIRTALTAFDYEINAKKLETPYKTAEEFQALVIQHVKDNLHIYFNEQNEVTLKNGRVKLGHESNIVFEVVGVPETINAVYVQNTSFKNIHRNQSALIVLKKGFKKNQFLLNEKNGHAMRLKIADNQLIPFEPTMMTSGINNSSIYIYALGIFLVIGIFGFLWTKRNPKISSELTLSVNN